MSEWLLSKRLETKGVGENVKKTESLCTVGRKANAATTMKNNMEIPLNIKLTYYP